MQVTIKMPFIRDHPYFADIDRNAAISQLQTQNKPILRPSSVTDHYAISYKIGTTVHHSLLHECSDGRIQTVTEAGGVYKTYKDIDTLIVVVWNPRIEDPQPCMAS